MADEQDINPQRNLRRLYENGPLLAQAKAERVYMEEYRKTLKAQLMKASGEKSAAAQEVEAYAHQNYVQHLVALREAVAAEEVLRWKMVTAQAAIEVWRSQEASNRNLDRSAA